jgi:hypothetical protein
MKPSSGQPDKLAEAAAPYSTGPDLEFPVDPGFISQPPRMTADQMYHFNMELMTFFNTRPEVAERRLRDKCDVPFVL